ncbi:Mix14p [Lachancea thermotolerans CBS 6340]|uniref:KLTH0C07612p n=1 Tax=Lachancea thermotolerans (strain ATCC 56472 / CBS 6340 / NRRL Y-8284) TaxID=559295 RepID=C5DEA5_LACTC|nr:KLTH0C07612p [Lachancea thermotolerans CBS 6340]CAR22116.1 KLTH0C07612p [Lachancea thermotolerans CBS 6340]
MSNALDQFIMEDVAKNCPQQFVEYHKCISKNKDDPGQCAFRQRDLSVCIKQKVPSVQKVMAKCGQLMQKYETCVRDNMETRTINENCLGLLQEMRTCAEKQVQGPSPINQL